MCMVCSFTFFTLSLVVTFFYLSLANTKVREHNIQHIFSVHTPWENVVSGSEKEKSVTYMSCMCVYALCVIYESCDI